MLAKATVDAISAFLRLPNFDRVTIEVSPEPTPTSLAITANKNTSVVVVKSGDEQSFVRQLLPIIAGYKQEALDDEEEDERPRAERARSDIAIECDQCDADPGEDCDCAKPSRSQALIGVEIEVDPNVLKVTGNEWDNKIIRLAFVKLLKRMEKSRAHTTRHSTKGTSYCPLEQCRNRDTNERLTLGTGSGMWYKGRGVNVSWKETLAHAIEHHHYCPPSVFIERIHELGGVIRRKRR